ncbi:MAG: hypothetical protein PVG25_06415, partial [Anaerolineae bacterium]
MPSRRWGLLFVAALVLGAVLLSIALIWQRRPEGATSTPDAVEEASLSPSISPSRTALAATTPSRRTPVTY